MIYEIENLTFSYRAGLAPVFTDVNLTLREGELLSILGRNGAGKSTLFGCMMGLHRPQTGTVRLCGKDLSSMNEKQISRLAGYVPQNHSSTFAYTVFEYVLMGCASRIGLLSHPGAKEKESARRAIAQMGIENLSDRVFSELSGGERQQVTIARAIAAEPKVILFDEPTSHLDFSNQIKVLRIIKDLSDSGYSVVVTTHDPNHALLLGGSVAVFDRDGTVRTGKVDDLVTEDSLKSVYGSDMRIRYMEEFDRNICIYPSL